MQYHQDTALSLSDKLYLAMIWQIVASDEISDKSSLPQDLSSSGPAIPEVLYTGSE